MVAVIKDIRYKPLISEYHTVLGQNHVVFQHALYMYYEFYKTSVLIYIYIHCYKGVLGLYILDMTEAKTQMCKL